jgi:hypothetical protein
LEFVSDFGNGVLSLVCLEITREKLKLDSKEEIRKVTKRTRHKNRDKKEKRKETIR